MEKRICKICKRKLSIVKFGDAGMRNRKQYYRHQCGQCLYRENYKKHKDKIWAKQKRYDSSPKGLYRAIKIRANLKNIDLCSKKSFLKWWNKQEKRCYYCQRTLRQIQKSSDSLLRKTLRLGVDKIDNNKGYIIKNMVLSCVRCNNIKNNYFTQKEMIKIGKIVAYKENK